MQLHHTYLHRYTHKHIRSYKFASRLFLQSFYIVCLVRAHRTVYFIFLVRFCWLLVQIFCFLRGDNSVEGLGTISDIITACINADGLDCTTEKNIVCGNCIGQQNAFVKLVYIWNTVTHYLYIPMSSGYPIQVHSSYSVLCTNKHTSVLRCCKFK